MKESSGRGNRDFSSYDEMPTEQLEEILRADFYLSDNGKSDGELVEHILEVIRERDKDIPDRRLTDPDEAWERFKNRQRSADDKVIDIHSAEKAERHTGRPNKIRYSRRLANIAAVLACVIIAGTTTACAAGINVWNMFKSWTEETFSFIPGAAERQSEEVIVPEQLQGLAEALEKYGATESVLPGHIPGGYELVKDDCYEQREFILLNTYISNEDSTISFLYMLYFEEDFYGEFEKDPGDHSFYEHNGITYYIYTNTEDSVVAWTNGRLECMITGLPEDEIYKVIESIK